MNRSPNTKQIPANLLITLAILLLICKIAHADFTFSEPMNLGSPVNTWYRDSGPNISADGLALYLLSNRPGGQGWDIWLATRTTTDELWGEPVNLGSPVNTSAAEIIPTLSADGLSLYFTSDRSGGYGDMDIWVTTRASALDPWGEPVNLGSTVNSNVWDARPSISTDGLSLYFGSNREKIGTAYSTLEYIYVTNRSTTDDPWGTPVRLGQSVNPGIWYDSSWPCISADDQILFFGSDRPGGMGGIDLWLARRSTEDGEWGPAVNLGTSINTPYNDRRISVSSDGRVLYFASNRPGGSGETDIWQSSIEPIVDFNGDGIVDATDLSIMIDHWGEDYSLCDIGRMPWGDGIVDVQDLIVLAEHLFEETAPVE